MNGMFTKTKTTRNTNININNSLEVLCKLIENPHVSLRDVSSKPTRVQQLLPTDYERRITFVAHMMVRLDDQPNFLEKIMWTDEARFHNNGTVNHHNNHYWSDKNPHWLNESKFFKK